MEISELPVDRATDALEYEYLLERRWQGNLRRRRLLLSMAVIPGAIGLAVIAILGFSTAYLGPSGEYRLILGLHVSPSWLATVAGATLLTSLLGLTTLYLETGFRNVLTRPAPQPEPPPSVETHESAASKSTDDAKRLRADTVDRLTTEIAALGVRGNLNLALGGVTALAGIVMLFAFFVVQTSLLSTAQPLQTKAGGTVDTSYFAGAGKPPKVATVLADHWGYLVEFFLPRLSIVVVVELFAYFFSTFIRHAWPISSIFRTK
jgi:hypothetical protein